jgi:hypothetical protein
MIQRSYKGIAEGVSKDHLTYIAGGVALYNKTVSDIRVAGRGRCQTTRYINININRFEIAGRYHLLVGFEVKHHFEANPMHERSVHAQKRRFQSVHSMKREGKNMSGTFRSVGGPTRCGTLCITKDNFNISQGHPDLDGQNLIDYNSKYPERMSLLNGTDNNTLAVCLRTKGGDIYYPPQILEPVWCMEDLSKDAIKLLKLTAGEWWDYTQAAADRVRRALAKTYSETTVSITLNTTVSSSVLVCAWTLLHEGADLYVSKRRSSLLLSRPNASDSREAVK